jgi:TATA-box binding protein (TBP) (component of TFIID and TFIIIB)
LGQVVPNVQSWIIGSIGLKWFGTSVLIFPNGKIKISGGCKGFQERFDDWLLEHRVRPVMDMLELQIAQHKMSLLNGLCHLTNVNMLNFHDIWKRMTNKDILNVTAPSMYTNPSKRGRICSIGVRVDGIKGSIRFDHSGKAQLFGFKSYEDMQTCVTILLKETQ